MTTHKPELVVLELSMHEEGDLMCTIIIKAQYMQGPNYMNVYKVIKKRQDSCSEGCKVKASNIW